MLKILLILMSDQISLREFRLMRDRLQAVFGKLLRQRPWKLLVSNTFTVRASESKTRGQSNDLHQASASLRSVWRKAKAEIHDKSI